MSNILSFFKHSETNHLFGWLINACIYILHTLTKCVETFSKWVETFSKCLCINAMGIFKNPQSLPNTQRVKIFWDLFPYKWTLKFLPLRNYIALLKCVVFINQVLYYKHFKWTCQFCDFVPILLNLGSLFPSLQSLIVWDTVQGMYIKVKPTWPL